MIKGNNIWFLLGWKITPEWNPFHDFHAMNNFLRCGNFFSSVYKLMEKHKTNLFQNKSETNILFLAEKKEKKHFLKKKSSSPPTIKIKCQLPNVDVIFVDKCYEMCSFSESTALKLANGCPEEFVNHNKKFMSRIYPNGMRVDSSNYNPQDLWNCGCQLG